MKQHLIAALAAADPAPATGGSGFLNSGSIKGFLIFIASVLLIVVGIRLFAKSDRGDVKGSLGTGLVVVVGAAIIALGVTGMFQSVGTGVMQSLFSAK